MPPSWWFILYGDREPNSKFCLVIRDPQSVLPLERFRKTAGKVCMPSRLNSWGPGRLIDASLRLRRR